MKKKVKEEINLKTIQELKKLLKDSEDLLFKLRLDKVQNKLKNQRQIFMERKKIALMLTLVNEKEKLEKMAKKEEKKGVRKNGKSEK